MLNEYRRQLADAVDAVFKLADDPWHPINLGEYGPSRSRERNTHTCGFDAADKHPAGWVSLEAVYGVLSFLFAVLAGQDDGIELFQSFQDLLDNVMVMRTLLSALESKV